MRGVQLGELYPAPKHDRTRAGGWNPREEMRAIAGVATLDEAHRTAQSMLGIARRAAFGTAEAPIIPPYTPILDTRVADKLEAIATALDEDVERPS